VRGGAPGTRETDLLDPVNTVEQVHGARAVGGLGVRLDTRPARCATSREGDRFPVGVGRVAIVPAAILFDLGVGDWKVRPDANAAYAAARAASSAAAVEEGCVGAGAGATVGKLRGLGRAMKAGTGSASLRLPNGAVVAALMAVNALGDVVDTSTGRPLAGLRTEDGKALRGRSRRSRQASARGVRCPARTRHRCGGHERRAHEDRSDARGADGPRRPGPAPSGRCTRRGMATRCSRSRRTPSGWTTRWLLVGSLAAEVVARAVVRAALTATSLAGASVGRRSRAELSAPAKTCARRPAWLRVSWWMTCARAVRGAVGERANRLWRTCGSAVENVRVGCGRTCESAVEMV